ncbi:protein of unknown function [Candidatus Methylomirabilis oxygeniifera]|uniref:Uncharacterized protein n=1 Tax=Methylomirabilis oxygeniifera TaxID=671143 RepID=D5MJD3_METO1|nr:protein of unknown function [Candidatus Methylomirabilis oxyfera]
MGGQNLEASIAPIAWIAFIAGIRLKFWE